MPPPKTMLAFNPAAVVPFSQNMRNLATELRRALSEMRSAGTILPSTLPPIALPDVRASDTPASAAERAVQSVIPPARTPAEQTARPGLIRRAIRYVTNRLAESLASGGGGARAARETLRRLRGRN